MKKWEFKYSEIKGMTPVFNTRSDEVAALIKAQGNIRHAITHDKETGICELELTPLEKELLEKEDISISWIVEEKEEEKSFEDRYQEALGHRPRPVVEATYKQVLKSLDKHYIHSNYLGDDNIPFSNLNKENPGHIPKIIEEIVDGTDKTFYTVIKDGLLNSKRFIYKDLEFDTIENPDFNKDFDLPFPICFFEHFDIVTPKAFGSFAQGDDKEVPRQTYTYDSILVGTSDYYRYDIILFGVDKSGMKCVDFHLSCNKDQIRIFIDNFLAGSASTVPEFACGVIATLLNQLQKKQLGSGSEDVVLRERREKSNKTKARVFNSEYILVTPKGNKEVPKYIGKAEKQKIDWTYSFMKMGHWRRLDNQRMYGKDQMGNRNQVGRTWVIPHVVGSGPLKERLRLVEPLRNIEENSDSIQ